MAKFCVKCRSALDPDARFCDECGEPVRVRTPVGGTVQAAAIAGRMPAAAPIDINWRKVGSWGGAGAGVLVVAGGVAAFLSMPPSTPSASDIATLLNADPVKVANATCLNNFPYEKNPVVVGGFDINTQQWMQVLSKAGVYGPPQQVTNGFLFGGGQQYSHTAAGEKKIHNGKLCFADGLTVSSVQFSKPVKIDRVWHAQGSYTYAYRNADAWIQTPEAQRAMPDRFADLPKTTFISLVKNEHGWQIDNGVTPGSGLDMQNAMQSPTSGESVSGDGLFSKLNAMLSALFGSRPVLVGKWIDDSGALGTLEFTANSAIMRGQTVPVTYRKDSTDSKRITVMSGEGLPIANIDLIDDDHFYLSLGFGKARFHRIG
jgi:hypothetical protein